MDKFKSFTLSNPADFETTEIVGPMGEYYGTLRGASKTFKTFLIDALNEKNKAAYKAAYGGKTQ